MTDADLRQALAEAAAACPECSPPAPLTVEDIAALWDQYEAGDLSAAEYVAALGLPPYVLLVM